MQKDYESGVRRNRTKRARSSLISWSNGELMLKQVYEGSRLKVWAIMLVNTVERQSDRGACRMQITHHSMKHA
ncbi:unnamed protein product [Sphenostylis stenocarpa]|uniref:Uncharacterized protein n=1 Tax=Sphenostylis stenocarpa TaxID=92480 RepID=A0AA86VF20_9FABA|nr:unnamed protein product [Sphenostylis stenocarpa]